MICPYSLRAQKYATVSTPLEWREVKKGLIPTSLNISSVPKRAHHSWQKLFENKQALDFT
jgi:DNA primase